MQNTRPCLFILFLSLAWHIQYAQQSVIDRAYFKDGTATEIGDLNLDGLNDFLGWSDDGYLVWYEQLPGGDLNFLPHDIGDPTSFFPSDKMEIIDINNDGRPDIIGSMDYSIIRIFINENIESMTYSHHELNREIGDGDYHVNYFETGDIDMDGDIDILISFYAPVPKLGWYENNGATPETFPYHSIPYTDLGGPEQIALRDYDADGDLDFYAFDFFDQHLYYFNNNGSGTFSQSLLIDKIYIDDIEPADMNNDGLMDIVICQDGSWMDENGFVEWLESNGDGTFQAPQIIHEPGISRMFILDFDEDGDLDVFSNYSDEYYENINAGESFAEAASYLEMLPVVPEELKALIKIDITGDGTDDLVAPVEYNFVLFKREPDLTFITEPVLLTTMWQELVYSSAANMDGDSIEDIVTIDADARINWYGYNDTTGKFDLAHRVERIGGYDYSDGTGIVINDFDMDGDDDILICKYETDEYDNDITDYTTHYYQNNGDGSFLPPVNLYFYFMKSECSDFDMDGLKDLLISTPNIAEPEVHLIKNMGFDVGSFAITGSSSRQTYDLNLLDYDMDGDEDAMMLDYYDNQLYALQTEGIFFTGTETAITTLPGNFRTQTFYFDDDVDGDKDLFMLVDETGVETIYKKENTGANIFLTEELISDIFPVSNYNSAHQLSAGDVNNDGMQDLLYCGDAFTYVKNTPTGIEPSPSYIIAYNPGSLLHVFDDGIPEYTCWDERALYFGENINDATFSNQVETDRLCDLNVYPNPAGDWVTISMPAGLGDVVITLYSISGKEIFSSHFNTPRPELNINELISGIYMITVTDDNGQYTCSFVKK